MTIIVYWENDDKSSYTDKDVVGSIRFKSKDRGPFHLVAMIDPSLFLKGCSEYKEKFSTKKSTFIYKVFPFICDEGKFNMLNMLIN